MPSLISKLLDKLSNRVSKDTVRVLEAIDDADLVKGLGDDVLKALSEYELVIPETRIQIRRKADSTGAVRG